MKAFMVLLGGVLVFGVILVGATVGCGTSGDTEPEKSAMDDFPTPTRSMASQQLADQAGSDAESADRTAPGQGGGIDQQQLEAFRERLSSGDLSQEEMAALRESFQGQGGMGARQGQPGAWGGIAGTIARIEGNVLTVDTDEGPVQAAVGEDTVISITSQVALGDLVAGTNVSVIGERDENGAFVASRITVMVEGAGGPLGGGRMRPAGGSTMMAGRALTGVVEKTDDNTVTISTPQGPIKATVGPDCAIVMTSEGTLEDLSTGMTVSVNGAPGEDGTIDARMISVVPADMEGFVGGFMGGQMGGRPGGAAPTPPAASGP